MGTLVESQILTLGCVHEDVALRASRRLGQDGGGDVPLMQAPGTCSPGVQHRAWTKSGLWESGSWAQGGWESGGGLENGGRGAGRAVLGEMSS